MADTGCLIRDAASAGDDHWEEVAELDRRFSPVLRSAARYRRLVEDGGDLLLLTRGAAVVGFSALNWALDEVTLLNIVVADHMRRRGCGQQLLSAALERASRRGARRVLLEARESNSAALALYRSVGFTRDATRRDYYPARGDQPAEGAVLMSLTLESSRAGAGNR